MDSLVTLTILPGDILPAVYTLMNELVVGLYAQ